MTHHKNSDSTQKNADCKTPSSPHPLFDPHWYAQQNPELPPESATFGHYLTDGWRNLKSPHPLFSVEYYFEQHPDVKAAGVEPLTHFITQGWKEAMNPHLEFDVATYLAQGPELNGMDPLTHYVVSGAWQGLAATSRAAASAIDKLPIYPINEQIDYFEMSLGKRFSQITDQNRDYFAFPSAQKGTVFEQYFVPPAPILSSMSLYFFTYHKPNGATLSIKLHVVARERRVLCYECVVLPDSIKDGRAFPIWLETPILNSNTKIFHLTVSVLELDATSSITIAGMKPDYQALCLTAHPSVADPGFALEFNKAPSPHAYKQFAFVSGCPGDAFRYRCQHQAEALRQAGYSVDVYEPGLLPYEQLLANYSIVVAHRVPHDDDFERFVREANSRGILVVYDTDDLVFDPHRIDQIDAYKHMTVQEQVLYLDGLNRYRRAMNVCNLVTVSTDKLSSAVIEAFPGKAVSIMRNCVSETMYQAAVQQPDGPQKNSTTVRIAYFSGTKTHAKDFAECLDAIIYVLNMCDFVRLLIVGHLDVPQHLQPYSDRIDIIPFVPWARLPEIYNTVDINLAPLELANEFTESKSELKYLEAALVKVPTVASDVGAYSRVIRNWATGVLCADKYEWMTALLRLANDRPLRTRIGAAAFVDVVENSSTVGVSSHMPRRWLNLARSINSDTRSKRVPSIAFVVRAPIALTGGGYKKIFLLANFLLSRGFDVRVHVEAIAHLEGKSDAFIRNFCKKYFDIEENAVIVGHDRIGPVDVAVATNWPTAPTVEGLQHAKVKLYFVQDFEPSFYEEGSAEYRLAEATYDLPLSFITIGDYLATKLNRRGRALRSVPFSVDDVFHNAGKMRSAECDAKSLSKTRCSILFFARPNIPRRNFAAGVAGLKLIWEKYGHNVEISLYGLDEFMVLPFEYTNLGHLTQDDLAARMAASDIHLSFSMTNISTVIYEAMASGCACVEADVESVRPMVQDGVNCILAVPNGYGVYDALDKLVGDADLRCKIAGCGHKFARRLTISSMATEFEKHIRDSCLV